MQHWPCVLAQFAEVQDLGNSIPGPGKPKTPLPPFYKITCLFHQQANTYQSHGKYYRNILGFYQGNTIPMWAPFAKPLCDFLPVLNSACLDFKQETNTE